MSLDLTATIGPHYDLNDYYGMSDWGSSGLGALGNPFSYFPYWRDATGRGEVIPIYLTELELKVIRDRSRVLCAGNEFAISALTSRRNYVIGNGLTYRALPTKEGGDTALADKVQKFIDVWREINDVPEREAESCWRTDEDGEAIIRLTPQWTGSMAGMTLLRAVEPELLRSPTGNVERESSFGIEVDPLDIENIVGYHIVDDPIKYNFPTLVPEVEVVHFKQNTRTTAKRGLPTLYPVEPNLKRAEDLLVSMTSMAKTRAKIALIRKFKGTGKSGAQTFADSLTEASLTDPVTGAVTNIERLRPGTILNSDGQKEYEFPHAQTAAAEFVLVLDCELRAVASRLKMPEWMLTANAANANYSNTFVAESDSVKSFEFLQDYFIRKWGVGRYGQKKSILWRCLDHAIEMGVLPEEVRTEVRIVVTAPSLVVRDKDREAATNKLYHDMNVKSRHSIQQDIGLDPPHEDNLIKNDELKVVDQTGGTQEQGKQPVQQQWNKQVRSAAVRNGNNRVKESDDSEGDEVDVEARQQLALISERLDRMAAVAPVQQPTTFQVVIPSNLFADMKLPDVINNVTVQPAEVHPTPVHVDAPNVTVEAPNVTVESPDVTVNSPVTVQPAATTILPAADTSPKTVRIEKQADGSHLATKVD